MKLVDMFFAFSTEFKNVYCLCDFISDLHVAKRRKSLIIIITRHKMISENTCLRERNYYNNHTNNLIWALVYLILKEDSNSWTEHVSNGDVLKKMEAKSTLMQNNCKQQLKSLTP